MARVYEIRAGPPETADYTFYGGARAYANYTGPEAIIHGPAETGKTLASLQKLHFCACAYPGAQIIIARKTLTSVYPTVLQTWVRKVLDEHAPCWPYGGQNKPQWYDYANGSRVWLAGMDRSSKILSAEFDLVYVNQCEELTLDDWEILTTRTTGRAGNMPFSQTMGDANPAWPSHWIYAREGLELFYSYHTENPELYDQVSGLITEQGERTMATLGRLTGVRKTRLLDGLPSRAEGMIYTDYREDVHLIYDHQVRPSFRYVGGQDWGYGSPGVLSVWAVDGEGRMYLVAQVYASRKNSAWWCERAAELNTEFQLEAVACDPSQPDYIADYQAAGINAVKAHTAILPGIGKVQERLALDDLGKPRIYFVRDNLRYRDQELESEHLPLSTEDELPGYVWASVKAKEVPVGERDHGCDAMRYAVAYVDGLGVTKKRQVRVMRRK